MPTHPCPYFSLSVGEIPLPGHPYPLRVPICRCVLTETLAARLHNHPDGVQLASYLEGPRLHGQPRPVIGSDLHPVSPLTCTHERKQASCLPQYLTLLDDFGLDKTVPAEK